MWSQVVKQLILEKQPANPHDEFAVTVIKDSQIVEHIPKNYLHITYFNIQRTLLYYWEKEERPIRSTVLILAIMDQQKTQCLFRYNAVSPSH